MFDWIHHTISIFSTISKFLLINFLSKLPCFILHYSRYKYRVIRTLQYKSSEKSYFRQFCNLTHEETRHLRRNGAMTMLKPRFTRTGEKLGKPVSQNWGEGGYAVFSLAADRFSFWCKKPEAARGAEAERWTRGERERWILNGLWEMDDETVGKERRSFSIESASSPQMQLNRTC